MILKIGEKNPTSLVLKVKREGTPDNFISVFSKIMLNSDKKKNILVIKIEELSQHNQRIVYIEKKHIT